MFAELAPETYPTLQVRHYEPEELVALALRHAPVFAPGAGFRYSNTNYVLAGMIIQRATGRDWRSEVTARIVVPLQLSSTFAPLDELDLPEPHAYGYHEFVDGGWLALRTLAWSVVTPRLSLMTRMAEVPAFRGVSVTPTLRPGDPPMSRGAGCAVRRGRPSGARLDDDLAIRYQGGMDGNSLTQWMATIFARSEPGGPKPDEYFTPRLAHADRQLQALATRLGGAYQRGALDWSTLAAPSGATPGEPSDALWGRGSRVSKRLHGLEIEVTVGVQPLATGELGLGTVPRWLVLAPGVTVSAGPRSGPLVFDRFDANWSADDDLATGADRLRYLRAREAAAPAALPAMPPSVTSARDRLIAKASTLVCTRAHVFVVGRPVPRAPEAPRHFGQGAFEVDALFDLVERARGAAHALATG